VPDTGTGPRTRSARFSSASPTLDRCPLEDLWDGGWAADGGGWLEDARGDGLMESQSLSHRDGDFLAHAEERRTPLGVQATSLAPALSSSAQHSTIQVTQHQ